MKPVDLIHHMPDEWNCVLQKAFAHVTKFFGGDHVLALNDLQRALESGRIAAMVRPLTDISKGCVLPVEFWQEHKLSSVGPDHIVVRSNEYPPMEYRYFLRQSDVEVWPLSGGSKPSGGSAKSLIKAELERRVAAGERYDTITELTQSLHEWMKTVSDRPLKPRSVENLLRLGKLWPLPRKK